MVAAFAMIVPFFFFGEPSGHDFEFHVYSWMEVLSQWRQGIIYPRWAALAHYGYGEARFLFYPPASWMLGAALGALLPWMVAPAAYIWVTLTAAGCSMFLLARRWLERKDATFAAVLYAANPYHIVVVYWRSAFAELLVGVLLPLLLLFVLRAEEEGRRVILPLGLLVGAAWLSDAPAAVIASYSLALLVVVVAILRRSPRVLLYGGVAVLLGLALAAFYVLPAAHEEKWVNISQVLSPGVRPQDNFLFTTINDPEHNLFNLLVSTVAAAELIALAVAMLFTRTWRRRVPALWWTVVAWAAASMLLMFPVTFLGWEYLPELRFVQLPWRWLLCLNVAFALVVTMAWRSLLSRLMLCLTMVAVLAFVWLRLQPPWWDSSHDIAEMQETLQEGHGYEGTDEYVPTGVDPYEINQHTDQVTFEGKGRARVQVQQWSAQDKVFQADVKGRGKLVLRLFNYPAWKVEVDGRPITTETHDVTGQVMIPIESGDHRVRIALVRTWDRTVGGAVSSVTVIFIIGLAIFRRWRRKIPLVARAAPL